MSAATLRIELAKPAAPAVFGELFAAGERLILVNGEPWARTLISHHGVYGTRYRFKQLNGETVIVDPAARHPREVSVSSSGRRRNWDDDKRPTEVRILEKARELVASGKLRAPDVVKAEQDAARERYRERVAANVRRQEAEFRERACQALGVNQDDGSELVDRVVAAMRWAQEK